MPETQAPNGAWHQPVLGNTLQWFIQEKLHLKEICFHITLSYQAKKQNSSHQLGPKPLPWSEEHPGKGRAAESSLCSLQGMHSWTDTGWGANGLSSGFSPTLAHINVPEETIHFSVCVGTPFFSDLFMYVHFSCFSSFSLYFQSFGTGIHCSFPSSPFSSQVHSFSLSTFHMFSPFTLWILELFCFPFPSAFLLIIPFVSHLQPFLFVLFLPPLFLSLLSRLRVAGVEFYIFFVNSLLLAAIFLPPPSQVGSRA